MSNGEPAGARRELQPRGAGPAGACPGRAGWDKFLHGAMEPVLHSRNTQQAADISCTFAHTKHGMLHTKAHHNKLQTATAPCNLLDMKTCRACNR